MSVLQNSSILAGASGSQGVASYNIARSLRFRSSASAFLSRTFTSAGNRKTWTYSTWIKRGAIGVRQALFGISGGSDSLTFFMGIDGSDRIELDGHSLLWKLTTAVYRDPAAYYHIVLAVDTTQATASNRIKLYVNNQQVTAFGTSNDPSLNADLGVNNNATHYIGQIGSTIYFDGLQTHNYFVDGQALTPSSFGENDAITGVWKPKAYSGSYGTNGFLLKFEDNSAATAAAIGKDSSGNGNNWTPSNISVTAGATYDSMLDVPTLTSATAANYCVLNPLNNYVSAIADGNLKVTTSDASNSRTTFCTIGAPSGKWYWEVTVVTKSASYYPGIGVNTNLSASPANQSGGDSTGYMYLGDGQKFNNGSLTSYGATYAAGDVIGVALDMTAGTITFYKNNTSQGQAFSGITGTAVPCIVGNTNSVATINFGQQPFAYTPPTGFKALNTFNLPDSTILAGNKHFDVSLYTGNNSTQSIVNSGGFQPDLVWLKQRSATPNSTWHLLYDAVRGAGKWLASNVTNAEGTIAQSLSAFNSNGFSVGADPDGSSNTGWNYSGASQVAWQWKASNASAVSNTSGSITSQVSANPSAGFSVVTYTGTGANATVGHGLGVALAFAMVKSRSSGLWNWGIWHKDLSGSTPLLTLTANALTNAYNAFRPGSNSSSVLAIGDEVTTNQSGGNYVAFCFAEVAGYSKFGSYTGNGSTDGPFLYTGFRPKWVMWKNISTGADHWYMYDSVRQTYNAVETYLSPSQAIAESTGGGKLDFLSNGFKIRNTGSDMNTNGAVYVYAAFAENPFKNSLAR